MVKKRRLSNISEDRLSEDSTEMKVDSLSNVDPPIVYTGNDLITAKGDHDTAGLVD